MIDLVVALLTGHVGANLRRLLRLAVFAAMVFVFASIALAAGAVALYVALADGLGPVRAACILAGVAAVAALLASLPLWRKSEPPPSAASTLAQLGLAAALGLMASRKAKKDTP